MPVDYTCRACALKVSLGWYHFGSACDGYGSATLLMCGQCGAQHRIDMAISEEARTWMMRPVVLWDVVLADAGEHRVKVMHAVHHELGCGLHEAMALVRSIPVKLGRRRMEDEARKLQARLEAVGARVNLISEPIQDILARKQPEIPRVQDALFLGIPTSEEGMEWQPCQVLGERTGETGHMEPRLQQCGQCHAQGTLLPDLPEKVNPCPRCGQRTLEETGGWVT